MTFALLHFLQPCSNCSRCSGFLSKSPEHINLQILSRAPFNMHLSFPDSIFFYSLILCHIDYALLVFKIFPFWALIASLPRYPKQSPVWIKTALKKYIILLFIVLYIWVKLNPIKSISIWQAIYIHAKHAGDMKTFVVFQTLKVSPKINDWNRESDGRQKWLNWNVILYHVYFL